MAAVYTRRANLYANRVPGQTPFGLFGCWAERFYALHVGPFRFEIYLKAVR